MSESVKCEHCGMSYNTLTDRDVRMHEQHCPYQDGCGLDQ